MGDSARARSVQGHPPSLIPQWLAGSAFDGAVLDPPGVEKSRLLALYDHLSPSHFAQIPDSLSDQDLSWLDQFHLARLDIEREERRMHFGALALVTVMLFLLLPTLISGGFSNLSMDLLALLLLALAGPYVMVYFGYENRVRAMGLGHLRLLEAMARRAQPPPSAGQGLPEPPTTG
jgi:hypothetical protein